MSQLASKTNLSSYIYIYIYIYISIALFSASLLSALILSSASVSADDSVVDDVTITVPVACNMTGELDTPHTATINPGQFAEGIGTTNFDVFCNDNSGYAIYAIGYSNEEYGNTKLLATINNTLNPTYDIITGTATSGSTSAWAMKLNPVAGTYTPTIENGFNNYSNVPNEYTKVATFTSNTDFTIGSSLQSTYQAYIAGTQPAGTYAGKVKYTLVHPNDTDAPIGDNRIAVIYDGNGLTFPGGASTNKVIYEKSCEDEYGYIGNTPGIIKTSNLDNDGVQNGSYSTGSGYYCDGNCFNTGYIEFEGASSLKTIATYGLSETEYYDEFDSAVTGGYNFSISGDDFNFNIGSYDGSQADSFTQIISGDSLSAYMEAWGPTKSGYDYGVFIQAYPVYNEPTEGATYGFVQNVCSYRPAVGNYAVTDPWYGHWSYKDNSDDEKEFYYETVDEYDDDWDGVMKYLQDNEETLLNSTITLTAYNPYRITYNGNNASGGTMDGFYTALDTNTADSTADLMAPNFKKNGYGFAGWSANQNATVNGNSKIYGPNEAIAGNELIFDETTRETTLYAVWVPTSGTMQNWAGCSSMANGQVTALTDNRDNNVYTVGKLADGNCWMMENLRLDNQYTTSAADIAKAQGYHSSFIGLADPENTHNWNSTTANSLYSIDGSTSAPAITGNDQRSRFPRYNNQNTASPATNMTTAWNDTTNTYSVGNWYTWSAAVADTSYYRTSNQTISGTSICPSGWHLPTGGSGSTEFGALDVAMGGTGGYQGTAEASNRWRSYPNNFIYSGYFSGDSPYHRGSDGRYWSSTVHDYGYSYELNLGSSYVNPGTGFSVKETGFSVRCVAGS